jgi:hypothetical protein
VVAVTTSEPCEIRTNTQWPPELDGT